MANNQEKDGKKAKAQPAAKAQPVSKTVRPRRVVEPKWPERYVLKIGAAGVARQWLTLSVADKAAHGKLCELLRWIRTQAPATAAQMWMTPTKEGAQAVNVSSMADAIESLIDLTNSARWSEQGAIPAAQFAEYISAANAATLLFQDYLNLKQSAADARRAAAQKAQDDRERRRRQQAAAALAVSKRQHKTGAAVPTAPAKTTTTANKPPARR
jgi:hypothetical protein